MKGGSNQENKEEKLRRRTTTTKTIRKVLRTRGNPNNNWGPEKKEDKAGRPGPKSEHI